MASNRGHRLRLEDISHRFGDFVAVRDINLDVAAGELVALLGPSGCGKSTLLRIVSGFIRQRSGRVLFDGEAVDHLPPSRRGAGIVFQNYALFPHMTVAENVAYGLEAHKWPRQRIGPRVAEMPRTRPHERVRYAQAAAALRRPAATRRACALPRHRSESAAARRAVRRARQESTPRYADRGEAPAARVRDHHHPRHPRSRGGAVYGGPHCGDGARIDRAGLVAHRNL